MEFKTILIIVSSFIVLAGAGTLLFFLSDVDDDVPLELVESDTYLWHESFQEVEFVDFNALSAQSGLSKQELCNDESYFLYCMKTEVENNFENVHCGTLDAQFGNFSMSDLCYVYQSYSTSRNFCSNIETEELDFICVWLFERRCPPVDIFLESYDGFLSLDLITTVLDFSEDVSRCEDMWYVERGDDFE